MKVNKQVIDEYKTILKQAYYKLNEKELYKELEEKKYIKNNCFLVPNKEKEIREIPIVDCWIYFAVNVENEQLILWVNIIYQDEVIYSIDLNNEIYNFIITKYSQIANKDVFDLFCDDKDLFVDMIFKYKKTVYIQEQLLKNMKYTSKNTWASNPGRLMLSEIKFEEISNIICKNPKEIKLLKKNKNKIIEHLRYGDTQPAIVVSTKPLIISSYSDELDCVVMLKYDEKIKEKYNLNIGNRLVTINLYSYETNNSDLIIGENVTCEFKDVLPIVGLFLSDDEEKCNRKVYEVENKLWTVLQEKTLQYLKEKPNIYREGFDYLLQMK